MGKNKALEKIIKANINCANLNINADINTIKINVINYTYLSESFCNLMYIRGLIR